MRKAFFIGLLIGILIGYAVKIERTDSVFLP